MVKDSAGLEGTQDGFGSHSISFMFSVHEPSIYSERKARLPAPAAIRTHLCLRLCRRRKVRLGRHRPKQSVSRH